MMRRAWIAAALNLFTVVGGHFYNKRPFTAFLFVLLLFTLPGLVIALLPVLVAGEDVSALLRNSFLVSAASVALLSIVSVILGFVHGIRGAREVPEGRVIRVSVAAFASLMCVWVLFTTVVMARSLILNSPTSGERANPSSAIEDFTFHENRQAMDGEYCLTRACYGTDARIELGRGEAWLAGNLVLDGRKLSGAQIAFLTDKGEVTETVTSDDEGNFKIPMPAGTYDLIKAKIKAKFPRGPWLYTLTTGKEGKLEGKVEMSGYEYLPVQPLRVSVTAGESKSLDLVLREQPRLVEPEFEEAGTYSAEQLSLEWVPVPDAASYGVVLSRITELDVGSRSFKPVARLVTDKPEASLEEVLEPAASGEAVPRYSVNIIAFDHEGRFIAENRNTVDEIRLPKSWKIKEECRFKTPCTPD